MSGGLFPEHDPPAPQDPTLDVAITVFLNRWVFNWRGERPVIEKELRILIEKAKQP